MKGNIILYTGNGGGKTAAALGLALRTAGHGKKAVIVQFMKGRRYVGEYRIMERLSPNYEIRQFGREGFVDLKDPSEQDKALAQEGLAFAREAAAKKPATLVLDEINLAAAVGLISVKDALDLLRFIPAGTIAILTGRNAPKGLMDYSDYVVEVKDLKRPAKDMPAREGFEY